MPRECPNCGRRLRERGPNFLRNLRRREIGDPHDKYVCENCHETFSRDEVFDEERTNITMKQWTNNE